MHDAIVPAPTKDGGDDVAEGVGNVEQSEDDGRVGVGWEGESRLYGDGEDVEGAEGYTCEEDDKENGWVAEVG